MARSGETPTDPAPRTDPTGPGRGLGCAGASFDTTRTEEKAKACRALPKNLMPNATIRYTCSRHSEGACDRGISSMVAETIAVEPPFLSPLLRSSERLTPRAFGHCVPSTSLAPLLGVTSFLQGFPSCRLDTRRCTMISRKWYHPRRRSPPGFEEHAASAVFYAPSPTAFPKGLWGHSQQFRKSAARGDPRKSVPMHPALNSNNPLPSTSR